MAQILKLQCTYSTNYSWKNPSVLNTSLDAYKNASFAPVKQATSSLPCNIIKLRFREVTAIPSHDAFQLLLKHPPSLTSPDSSVFSVHLLHGVFIFLSCWGSFPYIPTKAWEGALTEKVTLVERVNLAEVAKAEKVALTEVTIVEKVTIKTGFVLNHIYSIKIRLSAHAAKISDRFTTGKALVLGYAILLSLSLSTLSVKLEPFSFLGPNTRPEISDSCSKGSWESNQECCIMGGEAGENLAICETNLRLLMPMAEGYICMIRANLSSSPLPDPYPQKLSTVHWDPPNMFTHTG